MVLVDLSWHGVVGRGGYALITEAELLGCLLRRNALPPRQHYLEALRNLHLIVITVTAIKLTHTCVKEWHVSVNSLGIAVQVYSSTCRPVSLRMVPRNWHSVGNIERSIPDQGSNQCALPAPSRDEHSQIMNINTGFLRRTEFR
jgi:hypothetical protein